MGQRARGCWGLVVVAATACGGARSEPATAVVVDPPPPSAAPATSAGCTTEPPEALRPTLDRLLPEQVHEGDPADTILSSDEALLGRLGPADRDYPRVLDELAAEYQARSAPGVDTWRSERARFRARAIELWMELRRSVPTWDHGDFVLAALALASLDQDDAEHALLYASLLIDEWPESRYLAIGRLVRGTVEAARGATETAREDLRIASDDTTATPFALAAIAAIDCAAGTPAPDAGTR